MINLYMNERQVEDVTILDSLEQRPLLLEKYLRQARIEVTAGAAAHHGERGGASSSIVRDLDDVSHLLEAHGQ